MDFGPSHGIRLRFEDGLLDAVLLDLHRKPKLTLREELLGTGIQLGALAAPEVGAAVVTHDLGLGVRELELSESRNGEVTATLKQRFALRAPMSWRLRLNAEGKSSQQQTTFDLPNKLRISVETTAPFVLKRDGMRVDLPEGRSEVELAITSKPVFSCGDTIIVCRPDQMREAAIVASCLPARDFTPIIAIDPPPMEKSDYISHYKDFARSQDVMMSQVGGALGRTEINSAGTISKLRLWNDIITMKERRSSLTSYRSWFKRNLMISSLISGLRIERAIFLHHFTADELVTVDPGPLSRAVSLDDINADQPPVQMFDGLSVELDLCGVELPELTSAAWRLLREQQDSTPEHTIEVSINDTRSYIVALFIALRTGAALCAVNNPKSPIQELFAEVNPDAEEAVLVEDTGDVTALLGALYANHRSARLVVMPRPDLESVQRAVAEHQQKIIEAARVIRDNKEIVEFAEALQHYLSEGGKDPYADVEATVTAQVPPAVIAEVGDRRLSAFTRGLPYSFVHTSEASWAKKPIGHVTGDADLLILNELYSVGLQRAAGTFSLVFDPGFFRKSETGNVMQSVGEHFTHPILLSGPDANLLTLMQLSHRLPVELIFFNTHGSDDEIILAQGSLSSSLIVQWLQLDQRPIIFNNSCQSWTGVGREFIRVGARGYIGTLWSIPSDLAADYARIVVDRLTVKEEPASKAILNTGLSSVIERSYIYVGTANGRLDQWRDRTTPLGETALIECALLAGAIPRNNQAEITRPLRQEIHNLRGLVEGTPHEWTILHADALLSELSLIVGQDLPDKNDIEAAFALARQIDEVLERSVAPTEQINQRLADRFAETGRLYQRFNAWPEALTDYDRSTSYGDACTQRPNLLIQMATISMHQGKQVEALRLARSAYEEFKDKQDRGGRMMALGLLGQLSKRLGRLEDAMNQAREGYALAVQLEDLNEQGTFKLDESFIHELKGDLDAAIGAATKAVELFRINHNDIAELSAVGRLGACYLQKGDLESAERFASLGLAQAQRLAIPKEIGSFHLDIAEILTLRDRHAEALPHYREGVMVLGNTGAWELGGSAIAHLAACGYQLNDAGTLWLVAIWGGQFCEQLGDEHWPALMQVVVTALKKAIEIGSPAESSPHFQRLIELTMSKSPEEQPTQMRLLGSIVYLLLRWLMGESHLESADIARHLDNQTNGVFHLEDFIRVPYKS